MGQYGDRCTLAISRHLKVLLPPSSSSSHKLRISDELARHFEGDASAGGTALVVSPFGSKVWRVEVGRDGEGAFLGRGWPEFVAAHGIGVGWFVVLRHEGGGTLTVKAFDTSCYLYEFSRPLNVAANGSNTAGKPPSRRPQFIKVLLRRFTEKMVIPSQFVRNHITEAGTKSRLVAVLLSLCGKYWRVGVEKDRSGNMFFADGWSRFLASNGIAEGAALLLRYEGNMVFTVKVFGLDGCNKSFEPHREIRLQEIEKTDDPMKWKMKQDAPSSSIGKRKSRNEMPGVAEAKRPTKSSSARSNKTAAARNYCTYKIGQPSWIKKEMKAYALKSFLPLTSSFCKAVGFSEPCEITLRTSTSEGATRSWKVSGCVFRRSSSKLGHGWMSFCRDNGLKEGDVCTFNIIKTTLWHVDIARRS